MHLSKYRSLKNLTVEEAAAQNKVSSVGWRYWENGKKIPNKKNMKKIVEWSGGQVQPNDFYDLPKPASLSGGGNSGADGLPSSVSSISVERAGGRFASPPGFDECSTRQIELFHAGASS